MTREDLIEKYVSAHAECRWMDAGDMDDLLHSFVKELDSLGIPESLEEAAKEYAILPMDVGEGKVCIDKKVKRAFIAGAEYQRKQDQSLIELAEDHAMLAGMNKMKKEMMEKAVGGRYMKADGKVYVESWLLDIDPDSVKAGDEVRLIVIPEKSEKVK